jgi:hypothetical protein
VKTLAAKQLLNDVTTITIHPAGVPAAGAQARIGRIEVLEE